MTLSGLQGLQLRVRAHPPVVADSLTTHVGQRLSPQRSNTNAPETRQPVVGGSVRLEQSKRTYARPVSTVNWLSALVTSAEAIVRPTIVAKS